MKIALLEPLGVSRELIDELSAPIRAAGHEFVYYDRKTADPRELTDRSAGCEAVMIANNPYPDAVIDASKELKMINVAFTGIDHVGREAAKKRNILVCNAANYSNQTVAELVIGLVIALYRKVIPADETVRNGGISAGLTGRIVGTGRIGLMTARLFQAFGARVIAASRTEREEARAMGIEYMTLGDLMAESDIISIHTPNTPATRGLISRDMIGRMKKDAILINCARGPIVDSAALAEALNGERIAGAGIDVYNTEPPIPDSEPLLHAKNTVLTPHVAFLSEEAMVRRAHIAFDNMLAYIDGHPTNICEI